MIKIPDLIQLNDWEPKKFLRTMAAIHLAMLGAIGLDFMGLEIPILRQVVSFIYLTFVPGIIILKLLKLHKLGVTVTILLSAGLSISFLMFSGFFLNSVLSFLKINSPLSFQNVVIFITALVAILCILSYRIDKFYDNELPPLKISYSVLYLILLPVLSIVGTYFVNFHNNNIVILILIVLIALIPVLVALNKIPSELYPLAVFVIAISLLFHYSLISTYLIGWDIHIEYYLHQLVVDNKYWNSRISGNANAMLSIVILPAIYSYFLTIDVAWIFKIVYPIIFSLVPLGLYCVYQNQIKNDKLAFYSVFFFISFFAFFTELLSLARQQIAELFFLLLIFLTVQDTPNKNIRNILLLIFSASLVTSHYGLSYIYVYLIIFIFLFSIDVIRTSKMQFLMLPEFNLKKLPLTYFVAFYIVFLLLWYMNVSSSSAFESIVKIGDKIYGSIFTDFFGIGNRDPNLLMAIGVKDPTFPSLERDVHRGLQLITQFFIIIGLIKIIISREFSKFKAEYFYLIAGSFTFLLLSLLPNFAESFNMSRIYHVALFALSPLFVIGGIFFIEKSIKIIKIKNKLKQNYVFLILIMGVLVPYFLFNTGFIYELTNDTPTSISLGIERMKNDNITKVNLYNAYTPEQDVYSARWFNKNKDNNKRLYADSGSRNVLISYGKTQPYKINSIFFKGGKLNEYELNRIDYYIYLRNLNVCDNIYQGSVELDTSSSILPIFNKFGLFKIYSNRCSEIFTK
ncbi:MAG: DUF2206 domain-containing protein [Candidatus Methanoperedens sp.]|nr:DUF2206 domain-containing protein [Candidatus Methanoperedens sp.]